ncbi:MAG: AAA family ATPase [Pseudomonadota bacterium]
MQSQILPSRAALVDRIAMQFEYGQNLIALVGPSGLGKSYLAETLITEKYPEFNKAYIQVTAQMKDAELMTQLLQNSFRAPLVDQTQTLSENFFQLYQEQPCGPCFWVLDGARHLSDEFIEQLRILSAKSPVELFILVTAQAPRMLPSALDIHLERLSLSESKQLMAMFFKDLPMDEDPIFQAFLQESHGNPAVLLDWQASQQSTLRTSKPKKSYRWHLVGLTVLLALLLVAMMYQKQIQFYFSEQTASSESLETVLSTEQVLAENIDGQQVLEDQNQPASSPETLFKTDKVSNEHNAPVSNKQSESENVGQRDESAVSAVLTALESPTQVETLKPEESKEKPLETNTSQQVTTTSLSTPKVKAENAADLTELSIKAEPDNKPKQQAQSQDLDLSPTEWLLTQNDSVWAIQLLAVKDKAIANSFVLANELTDVYVYETVRNNIPWWVVIQAPFANIDAARSARQRLPANVLAGQPFFKKFERIKQEIQLVTR